MATIEELKREISREKNRSKNMQEINALGREKKKLEQELADLRFENKHGGKVRAMKAIGSGLKSAWGKFEKVAGQARKNLEEKERKGGLGLF